MAAASPFLVLLFLLLACATTSLRHDDRQNLRSDMSTDEHDEHIIVIDNQRPATTTKTRVLTNLTKDLRIINGYSAPELRYPYTASLQLNSQHYCGGALVAKDVVITAAHCAEITPVITLGRYDLDDPLDYDYEEMTVVNKIVHPQFDKVVVDNDVSLLILQKQSIHPTIRINNDPNVPYDGEELTVMGWGDIDDHPEVKVTSDELRETEVWHLTNTKCEQSKGIVKTNSGYQEASYNGELTDNMLCALDNIGTVSDACQGDSGGALVRTGSHPTGEEDVLVGLVSWGFGCSDPNFPGVYSRMSALFPWLRETICINSKEPPSYLFCDTINVPIAVAPSPAPPPSSSSGMLTFFIKTDRTPEDTGWELRTVPGNSIVASRPMGYYTQQLTEIIEKEIVQPDSFYRLIIYDRDRDGFQGIMAVYKGQSTAKEDLLVLEPGFSSKSQDSVSHGFYVGDNPPNVLTLDIKFDSNPVDLAWVLTNQEDNLQLGFRWFGFYSTASESVTETIPIYGSKRGSQEYQWLVYDSRGDGLCCTSGMGSYALYLGNSVNASNQIISGAQYLQSESCEFKIDSSGALESISIPPPTPTTNPDPTPTMATNPVGYNGASSATTTSGSSGTTALDNRGHSSEASPNGSVLVGPEAIGFSFLLSTTIAIVISLIR